MKFLLDNSNELHPAATGARTQGAALIGHSSTDAAYPSDAEPQSRHSLLKRPTTPLKQSDKRRAKPGLSATDGRGVVLTDATYCRDILPITHVAARLGLEPSGRRLRCPVDRAHWASVWLRKNRVKCFRCRRPAWTVIELVMEVLELDVRRALDWIGERFDVPKVRRRVTTSRWGKTRDSLVDYAAFRCPGRLQPSIATLRRAPGWPKLTHGARLLAQVLVEIIPWHTPAITTTQEHLRRLAGIGNRGTAKNAFDQLKRIGLVTTAREGTDRDVRSGQFTTAMCVRLTWGSPTFQQWLQGRSATQSKCPELNTDRTANGHETERGEAMPDRHQTEHGEVEPNTAEIEHGTAPADQGREVPFDKVSLDGFGQVVCHFIGRCNADFERVLEESIAFAREFKLEVPRHPAGVVRRIIDASR